MAVWNEDEAQRVSGFGGSVTQAVGSDAAIDLSDLQRTSGVLNDNAVTAKELDDAKALLIEHPEYVANSPKWRKYLDLYNSEDVFRFIFRHLRETDSKWQARVERGYFYNYVESVVELFTAFLYHHPVDRHAGSLSEDFEEIYKNADRSGTSWNTFMQEACSFAQVEGHVGVLVDLPKAESIDSEAERKELGIRPFLTLFHSLQIKDWEVDEFGNFIWVKLEVFRPEERTWRKAASISTRHYQIWSKTGWEEWELRKDNEGPMGEVARMTASGLHDLEVVPLCIVRMQKALHPWFGKSSVKDIADINIGILNWSSLGDEEIYERCLNVLAMEAGDDARPIELGDGNILEFAEGTQNKPYYLSPGATPLERIQDWIDHAKNEIRRLAKINLSAGLGDVRQASSGIAKAFSFIETNQSLAAKALNMEQAETKLHKLISKYLGKDFDGLVEYPREFGVEDLLTLYQELQAARSTLTSPTAIKTAEKKATRKVFARESLDLRQTIEDEIDDAEGIMENPADQFGMTPNSELTGSNSAKDAGSPNQTESGAGDLSQDQGTATSA